MASQYSVIQYVPDPIADERINIGVIVFGEGAPKARFLANWDRVNRFGREDTAYVRDFAGRLADTLNVLEDVWEPLDADAVENRFRGMIAGWINSIQFTEVRGSLEPSVRLLEEVVAAYLVEQPRRQQAYRDRSQVAVEMRGRIRNLLQRTIQEKPSDRYLASGKSLQGRYDKHAFDAVVANGSPYLAAHALSFEIPQPKHLLRIINSTAFQIEDVKKLRPGLPIAVVAQPPRQGAPEYGIATEMFERAMRIFAGIRSIMLAPAEVEAWAAPAVERLAEAEASILQERGDR